MKCRTVQKKLSAYQDRELKLREQEEIASHLAGCRDCRAQYAQLEMVRLTLAELAEIRPDPWFYRQVIGKIIAPRKQRLWSAFPHILRLLRAPAIASIILIIGLTAGGYFGTLVAKSGLFPFQKNAVSYAQEEPLFTTLKFFDPAPPGTFADGYLRMASYKEGSR
jgi:anti-sigma factor RsiW